MLGLAAIPVVLGAQRVSQQRVQAVDAVDVYTSDYGLWNARFVTTPHIPPEEQRTPYIAEDGTIECQGLTIDEVYDWASKHSRREPVPLGGVRPAEDPKTLVWDMKHDPTHKPPWRPGKGFALPKVQRIDPELQQLAQEVVDNAAEGMGPEAMEAAVRFVLDTSLGGE